MPRTHRVVIHGPHYGLHRAGARTLGHAVELLDPLDGVFDRQLRDRDRLLLPRQHVRLGSGNVRAVRIIQNA